MLSVLLLMLVLAAQPASLPHKGREVADLLLQQKYAEIFALFTPEMKKALPEDGLRSGASRLQAFGAVKAILGPEVQRSGDFDVVIVPVEFETMAVNIQVTFDKSGAIAGLFFRPRMPSAGPSPPPPYSRPDGFRTEEVTVGTGEWRLPGTLALPAGNGPFPAVVLVHGSGPNDRDETLGPNKPFRDLAEGLASRGVAVLRYEKRTRHYASRLGAAKDFTINQESVEDAVAAAALLRARPEIDPRRVFVLGHSLGGYVAPRIGQRDPKLAGLIILAGNARPLEDLILEQTAYLFSLKQPSPEQQKQIEEFRQVAARIKGLKSGGELAPTDIVMGAPPAYWIDLKDYDPAALARGLKMRLLVLQGERDYQVTMEDFAGWKKALEGVKTATLRSYPALNHLFMPGEGKSTPAEYSRPGHVALEVIQEIAEWVGRNGP